MRRLKIAHRQIDYLTAGPGEPLFGYPGKVIRSFEIERMNEWADDRDPATMAWYLLDVTPL